jgi:DNA-binding MarR family transcriptional regulator
MFADRVRELGIRPRQFAVLSHVAFGELRTQQQLADLLGIHRNNIVALIDEMEAAGWVERHRGESDRRVFEIRPTAAGLEIVAAVNELIPVIDDELLGSLSAAQRRQLTAALRTVADDLGLAAAVHPYVAGRRS